MYRCAVSACFIFVFACAAAAGPSEPTLKWSFTALSNLYAPPLIADVRPEPGAEIILSDSEARRLLCVDARGALLWECKAGWTKRLTTSAALSFRARQGQPTLIIGASDGSITCADAASGAVLWRKPAGVIEWGSVLWCDLDADGADEAVAGTEDKGVLVYRADGTESWAYRGADGEPPVRIQGPIAAADLDNDGKAEILAADATGPLCIDDNGARLWQRSACGDFICGVTVGDADRDGAPELYAASRNDDALFRFDARTGALEWKVPLLGTPDIYSASSLALGDLDGDGPDEIVLGDGQGHVTAFSCAGEVLWIFDTLKPSHAAVSLGDVDGDEAIEVLVASGDHHLYALDPAGRLEWRYAADLRLIYPATLADADGKTEILFCGSDKTLRCLSMDGRYQQERMPWPSRRCDVQQSASVFGRARPAPITVLAQIPLLLHGGFEAAKPAHQNQPAGWTADGDEEAVFARDTGAPFAGTASLDTATGAVSLRFYSAPAALDRGFKKLDAAIMTKGAAAAAQVEWLGASGVLCVDPLQPAGNEREWSRLAATGLVPPRGATSVRLACTTPPGTAASWDAATLTAQVMRPRNIRVLVNQVGYDTDAPKRFTVQGNFAAAKAAFDVVNVKGETVFSAPLKHEGRIQGAFGNDWGFEYWRGDFSAFDAPGQYRIRAALDDKTDLSWPFEIGLRLLWERTAVPAYRFFYYQRCGMAIPGFHGACHLDDAVSPDGAVQLELSGGWHDAGDYNKYHNAPYVFGLCQAYALRKDAFDRYDADGNGTADLFDEILWGGVHAMKMIAPDGSAYGPITSGYGFWGPPELETDNLHKTGDERRIGGLFQGNDPAMHLAAMAKIARYAADKDPWTAAAERAFAWCLDHNARGPLQFSAALDLYEITRDQKYATFAREFFPGVGIETIHAVRRYDELLGENHRDEMRAILTARAEEILALAQNPFGVYTFGPKERPNFFGTPAEGEGWHVGTSSHLLEAAALVALAQQFAPDPRYLVFIYDQFNWTLGNNPYDTSLMEGYGSTFPPTYHNRITFAGVPRGAIPGSVVNGIASRAPGDDRPYLDMSGADIPAFEPNEVWLPHNTAYLNAIVNLANATSGG